MAITKEDILEAVGGHEHVVTADLRSRIENGRSEVQTTALL